MVIPLDPHVYNSVITAPSVIKEKETNLIKKIIAIMNAIHNKLDFIFMIYPFFYFNKLLLIIASSFCTVFIYENFLLLG